MAKPRAIIERVPEYYAQLAVDLGPLRRVMNSDYSGEPVPEALVRPSIEREGNGLFVARSMEDGRVVGAITLSQIVSYELRKPEDFIGGTAVLPEFWGEGLGDQLCEAAAEFSRDHRANQGLTSNKTRPDRAHAIEVYKRNGFVERDTTAWHREIV